MPLYAQMDSDLPIDYPVNQPLFQLFLEQMPVAVAMFDCQMRYLLASRKWLTDYGLGEKNIIGHSHYDVFPDLSERLKEIHQRCLAGAVEEYEEGEFPVADGTTNWVRWEIHPWRDCAGEIGGIIMFAQAIAEPSQPESALKQAQEELETGDRKQDQTALQNTELMYRQILDAITDMVLVKGPASRIIWANKAFRDYYGMTNEQLRDLIDASFNEPDYTQQYIQDDAYVFNTGQTLVIPEEPVTRYDGKVRLFNTIKSAIFNAECQVVMTVGVSRDISDRKQVEKALQDSNIILRSVIDSTPDPVFVKDLDGRTIVVNSCFADFFGKSPEELIGKNDAELWPPDIACLIREKDLRIMTTGVAETFEELVPDNGVMQTYLSTKSPWRDREGNIIGLIGVCRNISDRKQAELALRESFAQTRLIADVLPAYISYIDSEQRYRWVNKKYEEWFGISMQEMAGKSVREMMNSEAAYQEIQVNLQRALAGKKVRYELKNTAVNGEDYYLDVAYIPHVGEAGDILGCLVFVQDITERKQAEEEVEESNTILRSIIESSPDIIYVKDPQGCFITINSAFASFYGKPIEEIIGKYDTDLFPPEVAQLFKDQDLRIITTGVGETFEEFVPENGIIRTYLTTKSPWRDVQGNIIGSIGISRDISDRKQAEEALRKSEAQLRQKAQREELLNQLANQIRESLNLDTILATTVQQIRSLLHLDRCMFIWYFPEPEPLWHIVHEAKNAELFSLLGYYPADATGTLAQRLLSMEIYQVDDVSGISDPVEQEFFLSLGYQSILDLPVKTHSGAMGVVACAQCDSVRSWSEEEVEIVLAICDQLAIAISQAELYAQTQDTARVAQEKAQQLEQTLNQLQQTQAQLVQTEKMSSLGQLVAGVAHEINNPVNFIYGNLVHVSEYAEDLLRLINLYQKHYPHPPAEIENTIEEIDVDFLVEDLPKTLASMRIGAERIRQIVLSLRNFSRLDEAEMKPVNIHEGIENTLLILQNRLKAKPDHPEIQVIKEYGNLPLVDCYAGQLNQVFMNLLTNAIDALDEYNSTRSLQEIKLNRSTITIHTELGHRSSLIGHRQENQSRIANSNLVVIRIADNGPGITEEVKRHLFDPFFTTKPVGKGTGLGLAISYQIIVEKHRGHIQCISEPGKGAEFVIEIPIKP